MNLFHHCGSFLCQNNSPLIWGIFDEQSLHNGYILVLKKSFKIGIFFNHQHTHPGKLDLNMKSTPLPPCGWPEMTLALRCKETIRRISSFWVTFNPKKWGKSAAQSFQPKVVIICRKSLGAPDKFLCFILANGSTVVDSGSKFSNKMKVVDKR